MLKSMAASRPLYATVNNFVESNYNFKHAGIIISCKIEFKRKEYKAEFNLRWFGWKKPSGQKILLIFLLLWFLIFLMNNSFRRK